MASIQRIRKERNQARIDAARYYRDRETARAEVLELRFQLSSVAVREVLRPEFPGATGSE